jgi:hypothetical protein
VPLVIVAKNNIVLQLVQKQVTVINVNTAWLLDIVQVTAAKVVAQDGAVVVL